VAEGNRLFAFVREVFVEYVEHFEKRHVLVDVIKLVVFETTFVFFVFLAPDLKFDFHAVYR